MHTSNQILIHSDITIYFLMYSTRENQLPFWHWFSFDLQGTADTLRRQVKDEVHTRTVLVARISNDTTDLSKYKTDTQVKNQKVGMLGALFDL